MENRIRIKEAIEYAKSKGIKIKRKDLAKFIFDDASSEHSAVVCLNNYENGIRTKMDRKQITEICKRLEVDPNYLFNVRPMSNINLKEDGKEEPTEPSGSV